MRDKRSYSSVLNRRPNTSRQTKPRFPRRQSMDERIFDDARPFHKAQNHNFKFRKNLHNFRNGTKYNLTKRFSDRNTLRNTMRNNLRQERNRIMYKNNNYKRNNNFKQNHIRYQSKFDRSRLGLRRLNTNRKNNFSNNNNNNNNNRFNRRRPPSPMDFRRSRRASSYESDDSFYEYSSRQTPESDSYESSLPPSPPSSPILLRRPQTPPPLPSTSNFKPQHFESPAPFTPNTLPMKTLVITGIKDSRDPRTEPLINMLVKIGDKLNVTLHRSDIDSISRFEGEDKIKVIFVHSSIKKLLMKNIRLKKSLSTREIDLQYDQQIYFNDELSVFGEFVFRKARYLKARRLIENTWTVDGKVLYKIRPGDTPRRCQTLEELLDLEKT